VEGTSLPGVRELDSIGAGVSAEDTCHRVIAGDVRVEARIVDGLRRRGGGHEVWGLDAGLQSL